MMVGWRHAFAGAIGVSTAGLLGVVLAGQAAAPSSQMAEAVFKDVQVLRGMPADEFLDTMGMFAAATAKDCSGCHNPDILKGVKEAFALPTPQLQIARRMVRMVNEINKNHFGTQKVTCYTCHQGRPVPNAMPNLAQQYGEPPDDNPNTLEFFPAPGATPAQIDELFGKMVQYLGGTAGLAKRTSLVAKGTYAGWDTAFGEVPIEIYVKAPNQLTTIVHRKEGVNNTVFDGKSAWFAGIDSAVPELTLELTGGSLAGLGSDALVMLTPHQIKQAYTRWQLGEDLVDEKPVLTLLGSTGNRLPIKLFVDENTGELIRYMRWRETGVGTIPIQYDYSDYRDVAGTKVPFKWTRTWTNNKAFFKLSDAQVNVAIDAARFAKPAPVAKK